LIFDARSLYISLPYKILYSFSRIFPSVALVPGCLEADPPHIQPLSWRRQQFSYNKNYSFVTYERKILSARFGANQRHH
jgi:hypothetical protein